MRPVDGTKINLMHLDGTLMAREPVVESALGQHFALFDSLLANHHAAPANSPLRVTSPLDGVKRFGALAPVAGYPLAIVETRDVALALAPWRAQTAGTVVRTLALSLLAVTLMALLQRQWVRLDKTLHSLEVSRERFALAVAGSDDGVWDFDYTSGEAFASQRARQIMGLPLQPEVQALDEWVARLPIHPEDRPLRQAAIEAHLAGRTPHYEGEWRIVHGDGRHRWVRVRGVCVRDAHGKPLRMAGSVSDVDARRRAEDALRQSEERYALAVAGSDDGVWDWDYASGLAFESTRARELQGLPLAPEVQPLADVVASLRVHPDDAPRRAEAVQAHLAGETPAYECEYRVLHADGGERWIRVRALCIRDAAGNPCRMAGSVSDIDSRKRAEDSLRRSEERFALAVAGANDGILDWNIVDDSMYVSERALRIVGIDASMRPSAIAPTGLHC